MKLHIYQIAITLISAIMIYKGLANYIKGKNGQTLLKITVRILVWGGMTFVALFPSFTNFVATTVGMESNINAVVLTGFLLIFLIIFKLLSAIERLEQNISELTRKDSLKNLN